MALQPGTGDPFVAPGSVQRHRLVNNFGLGTAPTDDPRNVEGPSDGGDDDLYVSLDSHDGFFIGRMGRIVEDGSGPDLRIQVFFGSYFTGGGDGFDGYCLYGSMNPAGPFYLIGADNISPDDHDGGAIDFDLGYIYQRLAPQPRMEYLAVLAWVGHNPLHADFRMTDSYVSVGEAVSFEDRSWQPSPHITRWSWDFGDGATSSERNPSHAYSVAGGFMVCLAVHDDDLWTGSAKRGTPYDDSICKVMVVAPSPPGDLPGIGTAAASEEESVGEAEGVFGKLGQGALEVGGPPKGDMDADGASDMVDNCVTVSNRSQADRDSDGVGDACDETILMTSATVSEPRFLRNDLDADGDGVRDQADNCPGSSNSSQDDRDGDHQGDVCDADADGDNFDESLSDNCPLLANPDQLDADGNGVGDACQGRPYDTVAVCRMGHCGRESPNSLDGGPPVAAPDGSVGSTVAGAAGWVPLAAVAAAGGLAEGLRRLVRSRHPP
ncbi:MAG TPA: thrombospondin type 3 repeat-containing protein [Candidatus Thermoplasmatota archaeon]|nr:thrombospondin type 3 repeat-containing protein [Candidatus Thermoplasmatota archaeon]